MEDLNLLTSIPVDEDYGGFEYLEDEEASSAYSVASSVYNFRVENGRRYHDYKDGHPFPYDEVSEENEQVLHAMILVLFDNRYFVSPVDESALHCVVDVGTGLGLWAEGVAERYPHAQVVGIDTIHHERSLQPNCSFIIQDATDEWVLDDPSMKLDLVHIRNLFVGVRDWDALYAQCFEKMNSGGWIEHLEFQIDARTDDGSELPDSQVVKLCKFVDDMTAASGRDFRFSSKMKDAIEAAGFVDAQEQTVKLPLGPWASDSKFKDIGRFCERFYKTGLQGWLLQICIRYFGWTLNEVNDACVKAFQEINSRQQHMYFSLIIVIGRKP